MGDCPFYQFSFFISNSLCYFWISLSSLKFWDLGEKLGERRNHLLNNYCCCNPAIRIFHEADSHMRIFWKTSTGISNLPSSMGRVMHSLVDLLLFPTLSALIFSLSSPWTCQFTAQHFISRILWLPKSTLLIDMRFRWLKLGYLPQQSINPSKFKHLCLADCWEHRQFLCYPFSLPVVRVCEVLIKSNPFYVWDKIKLHIRYMNPKKWWWRSDISVIIHKSLFAGNSLELCP